MDQFYTIPEVAEKCVEVLKKHVNFSDYDRILEPSAGTGSFYKLLPEGPRVGIDLDPKYEGVIVQDFLTYEAEPMKKYLVVGNPPFGRVSSLAVKFFNKASTFAEVIAFIIPRTFKRVSVQNRLSLNFELVYSEDLPEKPCCFSPKMSAKCCFQIWRKASEPRKKKVLEGRHEDFEFLSNGPKDEKNQPTPPEGADFALKAYGSNCGSITRDDLMNLRPKSWHWIKSKVAVDLLIDRFKALDYRISRDTVRQDSIGQSELVQLYSTKYR
jgi:hypothetical protein